MTQELADRKADGERERRGKGKGGEMAIYEYYRNTQLVSLGRRVVGTTSRVVDEEAAVEDEEAVEASWDDQVRSKMAVPVDYDDGHPSLHTPRRDVQENCTEYSQPQILAANFRLPDPLR